MPNSNTPGTRIRSLRESLDISPDELSELTGIDGPSAYTIAAIESGKIRTFGPYLQSLAGVFKVTPDYIMTGRYSSEDEIDNFATENFGDLEDRQRFATFARETSFRNKNLTEDELGVLKWEYLRRRKG